LKLEDLKAQVRGAWRSNYPKEADVRQKCSAEACRHVLSSPEFKQADQIGIFAGLAWELDLKALWEARPDACVFPKTSATTMAFFKIEKWSDLVPGYAGILEPLRDTPAHPWKVRDLILVPGSAFDRSGGRVGSGKGFYDRFLGSLPVQRWGIGYSAQIVDHGLAQGPLDVRMGAIVTELGISRI